MRFLVRVLLGAFMGLVAEIGLHYALHSWWLGALVGGLVGALCFLATFFVWSADRPDEGYEQVLFDMPNSVISGIMIVALFGVGFGLSFLGHGSAPVDPNVAVMNAQHDKLVSIYNAMTTGKMDAAAAKQARDDIKAAQDVFATLPDSPRLQLLRAAAGGDAAGLDAYEKCGDKVCQASTLALLDAKDPLDKYATG